MYLVGKIYRSPHDTEAANNHYLVVKDVGNIDELLGLRENLLNQLEQDAIWLAKRYDVRENGNNEAFKYAVPQYDSCGILEHSDPFFKAQLQEFPIQIGPGFSES